MPSTRLLASCTACASILSLGYATAASAQVVPSTAQPGRASEQFQPTQPAPPQLVPGINAPVTDIEAPEGAEDIHFTLKSVAILGTTAYTQEQLRSTYAPYLGKRISLEDAYRIAATITYIYRQDGYLLSRAIIPEQEVADGTLTIRVVEGVIGKVYFQQPDGSIRKPTSLQRRIARKLEKQKPLKFTDLEKTMLLLNELPGQTARAVLKASPDTPGAADVYVLLTKKKFGGYIQADNRGSRYQGPVQYFGGITVNQLFDDSDQLSARIATTYQTHELKFGEVGYQKTLTEDGLRLNISANRNLTHPGANLKPFEVEGEDNLYEARLTYPLERTRTASTDVYGTFDWRDVSSDALGVQLSEDNLRILRLGVTRQRMDSWNGVNILNAEYSQGLDIFGASGKNDGGSRAEAAAGFKKVTAQLSREQYLGTSRWSLYGALTGQLAPNALPASEEFGLGGERFGSAYDSSELTGESGIGARIEARYLVVPDNRKFLQSAQPYAFYDVGMIHNTDPGTGIKDDQSLASAGVGVRMGFSGGYNVSLEVAQPLSREVAALNSDSPRIFFKVGKFF